MNFLVKERRALETYLPGLDEYLTGMPLAALEARGNGALKKFREVGGPGLLVPKA